ncbi:MAG: hypothetical protein ACFE9R_17465 [Candidatus Hermodarchaeota archaeon]
MKSVANQVLRESSGDSKAYMIDPFYHYTPEREILIDLKEVTFNTKLDEDDAERYYRSIVNWFHQVLPKEGIPMEIINKAILKITPSGKECIIEAQGRTFRSFLKF